MKSLPFMVIPLVGCMAAPPPAPPPPTQTIIKIIRVPAPPIVRRGSVAADVLREYRRQEQRLPEVVSDPDATPQQTRDMNAAGAAARLATQRMINQDGHSTAQDFKAAHDALDAMEKANNAPRKSREELQNSDDDKPPPVEDDKLK